MMLVRQLEFVTCQVSFVGEDRAYSVGEISLLRYLGSGECSRGV